MSKVLINQFTDYKDKVINLLKRVCTVSVRTMEIIEEMEKVQDISFLL